MKLAFAMFTWFPHGGLTRDLIAIARTCRQRGHRVRVYAGECRGPLPDQLDAGDSGLELQLVPAKAHTNHNKNRRFARRLKNAVAEFSPDLLVGFNKMPGLDVYYAADGCFASRRRLRNWWYRMTPRCRHFLAFEKAVFSRQSSTEILMIAPNQMRTYQDFYDLPKARMTLLAPGISRNRIAGEDAPARRKRFRDRWQLNDGDTLLLAVGSGFRTKGLDRTLRAFASLPPHHLETTRLFVVGSDKARPFEKIAQRLRVHSKVRFLQGRDDVPEFLLGADLLIHPAYLEAGGIVLLEAMVAGLPVITTNVCGYAHYVCDAGMGEVLASPFEQSALNRGLRRLIEAERTTWRERGRDFAKTADIYDMPLHACRRIEAIAEQKKSEQRSRQSNNQTGGSDAVMLYLEKEIAEAWAGDDPFVRAQQQQGEVFREKEGRRTMRFALGEKHYFLKLHQGVGWGEVIKNLLQLRLPVTGARNEWLAIQKLPQLGLHTMTAVGYGRRGLNPAKQLSFLITDELTNTLSLEDLCATWARQPCGFALKQALIARVAEIARTLHENGVNHRDFYLCHLLADVSMGKENLTPENLHLSVVDLHRAQIRKKTPSRWIAKDLGGLYFSVLEIGLTSRDVLRFMKAYSRKNLRQLLNERTFWLKVERRAKQIHRRDFGCEATMPLK